MDKLTKLAIKYKTDRWGKHHYTPHYHSLFKKKKNIKKFLEIGVGEGLGLYMWRDYFPKAMIYGAEIDPRRVFEEYRIKVYPCDQSKSEDLAEMFGLIGVDIDIVVDDGSHKPEDQVFSAMTILPILKKGAIYVIEDVADLKILEPLSKEYATHTIECGKRYDDRLIVIRK